MGNNKSRWSVASLIEDEAEQEKDDDDGFEEVYVHCNAKKAGKKELAKYAREQELLDILGQFSNSDMEAMFGDHTQTTITRKKVEVDEYDHD